MKKNQKSILFHYPVFNIGGAEKSLLRLTKLLCDKGWRVSIVLTTAGGDLEGQIDQRVTIHHLRSFAAGDRFKNARGFERIRHLGDLALYGLTRIEGFLKSCLFLSRKYDAAAVSLHGLSPAFVCRFVRAETKLQWIRNDLAHCDTDKRAADHIEKYHRCIDHYICVSQTSYESLQRLFPQTIGKSSVIPNVIEASQMVDMGRDRIAPLPFDDGKRLKVVTVCRLSDKAKGLLRMVRVHRRLDEEGIDFLWYVVGDGPDREKMRRAIVEAGLEEKMLLLGSKPNPFPYYKAADISATLSYYEGLCGAVNEAKIVGKPVLATEFSGIYDQIEHERSGLIVANEEDAIYEGLKRLLKDDSLRKRLTNSVLPRDILDDDHKLESLLSIIEK